MINRSADELRDLILRVLVAAGADERNAKGVAEHLVLANLSGVDTHGIWHLPGYVDAIAAGLIIPTAWPEIVVDKPNSAQISGGWTFGQIAAGFAMEQTIARAKIQDMACVSLVRAHHIGRLGHYVEMAADHNLISMVWAGGYGEENPAARPYGGREPFLHTNPIAMGFPGGDGQAMAFDFATTALSGVKIDDARRRGEPLPPGAIIDHAGHPSTDPEDFFSGGGHLPFGAHKGYALMLAAEFLGRIFCGSNACADPNRGGPILRHQGVTLIAFKADLFQPFAAYAEQADEIGHRTRAIAPAPGFDAVLMPGDREASTRKIRTQDGIPIPDDIWQTIVDTARSVSITDI